MQILDDRHEATIHQISVREHNNARVLNLLRCGTPLSRAQLSRRTGLNRSTVSSIINELIREGYVREIGLRQVSTGRPSVMLEIAPDGHGVLGLDIASDSIDIVISDFSGQILWLHTLRTGAQT